MVSLRNPFEYKVGGYINFVNYYNNYYPPKLQYYIELDPNETKSLLIPINITKSCDIKWNVVYYPLYKDKLLGDAELKYYQWDFEKKIDVSKYSKKPIEESIVYKYINTYSKVVNISTSEVVVKIIRCYDGEYIVSKDIVVSTKSIYFYIATSLSGFMIGLITILTVIKKRGL